MTGPTRCSRCGAPLVDAAAGPVCPACLLKLGLATPTAGETVMASAPDAGVTVIAAPPTGGETRLAASTGAGEASTVLGAPTPGVVSGRAGAPPSQIGPYRLVSTLGEGGMGVVYLAEQSEPIRRTVALKLIKLGMDTHEVVGRFEAERQALALMDHPNIASVLDAGATADGRPYFVMEYAPGAPITDYCDAHQLTTRQRVELFLDVCAAVQHAHQKGIIHRDLKPSNVLVIEQDGKPVPKVIDFGIAKATEQRLTERTMFTQHGALIGTPEYMSPEQADPGAADIDTRTDIYAMGVILYEMLVGALPFSPTRLRQAAYSELLRIIREEEPARPSTRLSGIEATSGDAPTNRRTTLPGLSAQLRGDLDWITLKALEKERTRRYASASEFSADLSRYFNNEPIVARPAAVGYRVKKFVRRNRLMVTAASLVFLAVVAGLVVSSVLYVKEGRARRDATSAQLEASSRADSEAIARRAADAAKTDADMQRGIAEREAAAATAAGTRADQQRALAERHACEANILAADITLRADNIQEARRRLDACPAALQTWEWRYLDRTLDASSLALETSGSPLQVGFRDTGHAQAVVLEGSGFSARLRLANGSIGQDALQLRGTQDESTVAVSADGRLRIVSQWSAAGFRRDASVPGTFVATDGRTPPAQSPADSLMLRDTASGRNVVLELPDIGRVKSQGGGSFRPVRGPEFFAIVGGPSPNSSASSGGQTNLSGAFPYVVDAVFSPDGTRVAAWSWMNEVSVWDTSSGRRVATLKGHTDAISAVRFAADSGRLVTASYDRTIGIWDIAQEKRVTTLEIPGRSLSVATSLDGLLVAGGGDDGVVRVWLAQTGRLLWKREDAGLVHDLAFRSDGRQLAAASGDRTVHVWDTSNGFAVARLRGHSGPLRAVMFGADARLISGADDKTLRVWEIGSASLSVIGRTEQAPGPFSIAWARSGEAVLSPMRDGRPRSWSMSSVPSGRAESATALNVVSPGGPPPSSTSPARAPGSITGSADGVIAVTTGAKPTAVAPRTTGPPALSPAVLTFSSDGALVADSNVEKVRIWNAASGQLLHTLQGHLEPVTALAFSRDGHRLVSASVDRTLRAWDVRTGQQLTSVSTEGAPDPVVVSPDGKWVVSADGNTGIHVRQFGTLKSIRVVLTQGRAASALAISPDGQHLLSILDDTSVQVRDVATLRVLATSNSPDVAHSSVYHPDGSRIAVALADGSIRLWDAITLETVLTLGNDAIVDIAGGNLNPAMREMLAGSSLPRPLIALPRSPVALSFSPDGLRLASAWTDNTIRVFSAAPKSAAQRARDLAERLFAELAFSDEVIERVRSDGRVDPAVRDMVVRVARARGDDPAVLYAASWRVVKTPGASPDDYRVALRRAEAAHRLQPDRPDRLNVVALAQYRMRQFQNALDSLVRISKLRRPAEADTVVSVLARLGLGQVETAQADLDGLLALRSPAPDLAALIKEAKALAEKLGRRR